MATPGNGPISLGDIRNEIGRGGPISFADGDVQDLLGSTDVLNLAQPGSNSDPGSPSANPA